MALGTTLMPRTAGLMARTEKMAPTPMSAMASAPTWPACFRSSGVLAWLQRRSLKCLSPLGPRQT